MTMQQTIDERNGRDTIEVLERMMLDYLVERRRSILTELAGIDKQLVILRAGPPTKAERERAAYQERQKR